MRKISNILNYCLIALISLLFIITSSSFAQTSSPFHLSYKVLESYSDDTTLTMIVRLRVKNAGLTPLEQVSIQANNSFNASVQAGEIYFDQIKPNETVLSADNLIITIDMSLYDQRAPDTSIVWLVHYIDDDKNTIREEIAL